MPDAIAEMEWVIRLITEIRSVRSEMNVPAGAKMPCVLAHPSGSVNGARQTLGGRNFRLARLESLELWRMPCRKTRPRSYMDETVVALPLAGVIDFACGKSAA